MISIRCSLDPLPFMREGDVLPVILEVLGDMAPETKLHVRLMGIQGGINSNIYDEQTLIATSGSGNKSISFEIRARSTGTPILIISSPSRVFSEMTIRGSHNMRMPPSHGRSPGSQHLVPVNQRSRVPTPPPPPPTDLGATLALAPHLLSAPEPEGLIRLEDADSSARVEPVVEPPSPLSDVFDAPKARSFDLEESEGSVASKGSGSLMWTLLLGSALIVFCVFSLFQSIHMLDREDPADLVAIPDQPVTSVDETTTPKPIVLPPPDLRPCTQFKLLHGAAGGPERDGCYVMGCQEGYAAAWRLENGSWQRCERYEVRQNDSCVLISDSDGSEHAARFKNGQWTSAKCQPSN